MESRVGRSKQRESLPDAQYNIFWFESIFLGTFDLLGFL